jgi:hypothetical protein
VYDLPESLIVETRIEQAGSAQVRLVDGVAPSSYPVFVPVGFIGFGWLCGGGNDKCDSC